MQVMLTSAFGFADFMTGEGAVRIAPPVAVAETAGGQNDQVAIVRLRQDGRDNQPPPKKRLERTVCSAVDRG